MRFVLAVLLLAFLGAIAVFAIQNNQVITVQMLSWAVPAPVALTVVAAYVLGMVSGWTVLAFVRRSIRRIRHTNP
jgi:uncharacterized integral membrane protein